MAENGDNVTEDAEMPECEGEKVVTMMDVLQEQQEFEDDANAVLGASDEKDCTYAKGYIKRQAIYVCLTCCPDAKTDVTKRAGVCLACSLNCHENHEHVELYTKRNFRCDCGNPKFNSHPCQYTPEKTDYNEGNTYNQNFSGLYCVCHRPYPDPDSTVEDEMIQCIICEDWLHASHLGSKVPSNDQYSEMICKSCMENNDFLHDYSEFAVTSENVDVDVCIDDTCETNIAVHINGSKEGNQECLVSDVDKVPIKNIETSTNDNSNSKLENKDIVIEKESQEETQADKHTDDSLLTEQNSVETGSKESKNVENATNSQFENSTQPLPINNTDENTSTQINTDMDAENVETEKATTIANENMFSVKTTNQDEVQDTEDPNTLNDIDKSTTNDQSQPATNQPEKTDEIAKHASEAELNNEVSKDSTEQNLIQEEGESKNSENPVEKIGDDVIDKSDENLMNEINDLLNENPTDNAIQENSQTLDSAKPSSAENISEATETGAIQLASDEDNPKTLTSLTANVEKSENITSTSNTEDKCDTSEKPDQNSPSLHFQHETSETNPVEDIAEDSNNTCDVDIKKKLNSSNDSEINKISEKENEVHCVPEKEVVTETSTHENKRRLSQEKDEVVIKKLKLEENKKCSRPQGVKRVLSGATFWSSNFRQKLCTCTECITMYKDMSILFLVDPEDTVTAYVNLGKQKVEGTASQYEKGLQALLSLDRVHQINALTEYNKMRDKLIIFLKSFIDRKEIVKEEDIKAFFADIKPKREPDGVYFCR